MTRTIRKVGFMWLASYEHCDYLYGSHARAVEGLDRSMHTDPDTWLFGEQFLRNAERVLTQMKREGYV